MAELGMLKVAIAIEVANTKRSTKKIIQELIETRHLNDNQIKLLNDIVTEVKKAFVDDI